MLSDVKCHGDVFCGIAFEVVWADGVYGWMGRYHA